MRRSLSRCRHVPVASSRQRRFASGRSWFSTVVSRASCRRRKHLHETEMREVVFALLPRVVLLDVAGPADAFRNANTKVANSYRLRFVAAAPNLSSAVGLQLGGLEPLPSELPDEAIVVLAGGG